MKIFYDCEFIEDGRTIELISIGMVADDGRELYMINREVDLKRIAGHQWLMDNVVTSLPLALADDGLLWNRLHPDYAVTKPRWRIADDVKAFIQATPDPELWAWYGAYDHVALAQLWGPMIDLPAGVPMWTNDVRQEVARLGLDYDALPAQVVGEHNALADARHVRRLHGHVRAAEAPAVLGNGEQA